MFLPLPGLQCGKGPFLCLRRGVSMVDLWRLAFSRFSLPTQRCFSNVPTRLIGTSLFSAYAEVFLSCRSAAAFFASFLCLRRGVSAAVISDSFRACFSLPTQRCFPRLRGDVTQSLLFSAYAEVFPQRKMPSQLSSAFLCLRRGVSPREPGLFGVRKLFSAYAEVFLYMVL